MRIKVVLNDEAQPSANGLMWRPGAIQLEDQKVHRQLAVARGALMKGEIVGLLSPPRREGLQIVADMDFFDPRGHLDEFEFRTLFSHVEIHNNMIQRATLRDIELRRTPLTAL